MVVAGTTAAVLVVLVPMVTVLVVAMKMRLFIFASFLGSVMFLWQIEVLLVFVFIKTKRFRGR